jgi:predicted nucleotidyltransferase
MKRKEIVAHLSEIIHREVPDAKVILYGSEARGEASYNSDIDVLILLEKEKISFEDEEKIRLPLYMLELKSGVLISPMIVSKKTWFNRPFKTPFYINVMNEGIEI